MSKLSRYFREPWFINMLQIVGYGLAVICGFLAATNGIPQIVTGQIGPVLSVVVGGVLIFGGSVGAYAVHTGNWALERVAIWITGLGYAALLVPTLGYALTPGKSSSLWLIVALEIAAILDAMKRYRRIDWAYLDPAK